MSEFIYSNKKQIDPLVKKYGINPETNTLFQNIITLFSDTPNYQVWGVKAVFSKVASLDDLKEIKQWANENKSLIKKLSKQNIVAYSTATDFGKLKGEIKKLNGIAFVKGISDTFNTAQKHMIERDIDFSHITVANMASNNAFKYWLGVFRKFNRMPKSRQRTFISRCSTFHSIDSLKDGLKKAIEESYLWNKDDFMSFMENNTPKCQVIYDKGNIVIVKVPDFTSSLKLGGSGHTGWCIATSKGNWDNYTNNGQNDQYFLFNFGVPETDELSHIGFTIKPKHGFTAVQTTQNHSILDSGISYHGQSMNVYKAFSSLGVKMGMFISLKKPAWLNWDEESLLKFIQKKKQLYPIAYDKDKRVVIQVVNNDALSEIIGHTFIKTDNIRISDSSKAYVMFDFNLDADEGKSIILFQSKKDAYNIDNIVNVFDIYGANIMNENYLPTIGMKYDDFLNREKIDPSILLHKLINENDEKAALDLIKKEGKEIDVNYEFNGTYPVYLALENKMFDLFSIIINDKKFDSRVKDGFEDTILTSLLYIYGTDEIEKTKADEQNMEKAIKSVLESPNYDFNLKDLSNDTALNIALQYPKASWVAQALIANPKVNVNNVDDFGNSPLMTAIQSKDMNSIKMLLMRQDIKITSDDEKTAKHESIDIKKMKSEADAEKGKEKSKDFSAILERVLAAVH